MTPVLPVAKFTAGVVEAGGKFATVVADTSFSPWLVSISTNFEKNWNVIIRGFVEDDL